MKLFLTGSSGQVGKDICDHFHRQGCEIFLYGRGSNIRRDLEYFVPSHIINCAGEVHDKMAMYESNIHLLWQILEYVKNKPHIKMVHIGSYAEYESSKIASKEVDLITPRDVFQASKSAGTLLCQGYARQYGLPVNVVRPYRIYGIHEKAHRLFSKLYRSTYQNEFMNLYNGHHDFIHVKDFIRGIGLVLNSDNKADIVNLGSGIQTKNIEVADMFKKVSSLHPNLVYEERYIKESDSNIYICDTSYAKQKYGFQIEYNLEAGIRDFISKMSGVN